MLAEIRSNMFRFLIKFQHHEDIHIQKYTNIQMYRTTLLLSVKYVSENWCLILKEEYRKGCLSTRSRSRLTDLRAGINCLTKYS